MSTMNRRSDDEVPPWKEIQPGRFQPQRTRGSCLGRELGWTFTIPPGPGETPQQPILQFESERDEDR